MHASPSTLKPLDSLCAVLHNLQVMHFSLTIAPYMRRWDGPLLTNRREQRSVLLNYKANLQELPSYICSVVEFKDSTYNVRSQSSSCTTVCNNINTASRL